MNFWLGFLTAWAIMSAVILVIEYCTSREVYLFGILITPLTIEACWVMVVITLPISASFLIIYTVAKLLHSKLGGRRGDKHE